jgi:hypothetical protein
MESSFHDAAQRKIHWWGHGATRPVGNNAHGSDATTSTGGSSSSRNDSDAVMVISLRSNTQGVLVVLIC